LDNRTLETNPHTLAGTTHGERMDIYMLGKLALPVVVGIMGVAAVLTLAMGIFTSLKTLCSPTNVECFFQQLEESRTKNVQVARRSSLTINIHPGKRPSQPPMQEHE